MVWNGDGDPLLRIWTWKLRLFSTPIHSMVRKMNQKDYDSAGGRPEVPALSRFNLDGRHFHTPGVQTLYESDFLV